VLSRAQLEKLSKTVINGNIGHAEKLYLQDIILSTVSKETSDQLIFKGGTALLKFYQLDRFSEDLDFTKNGDIELKPLLNKMVRDLENYGAEVDEKKIEEHENSFIARLGIEGPLYTGKRKSLCFISLEISKREDAENPENRRYNPVFQDINSFDLLVLSEQEILAEKIRALRTRDKPRDLYDIYHLLSKGIKINEELTQNKLDYYDLEYSEEAAVKEAKKLEKSWEILDKLTYSETPEFQEAIEKLEEALEE
jgi:predicted nucleotidyltransferase component of viral defense system